MLCKKRNTRIKTTQRSRRTNRPPDRWTSLVEEKVQRNLEVCLTQSSEGHRSVRARQSRRGSEDEGEEEGEGEEKGMDGHDEGQGGEGEGELKVRREETTAGQNAGGESTLFLRYDVLAVLPRQTLPMSTRDSRLWGREISILLYYLRCDYSMLFIILALALKCVIERLNMVFRTYHLEYYGVVLCYGVYNPLTRLKRPALFEFEGPFVWLRLLRQFLAVGDRDALAIVYTATMVLL